MARKGRGMIIRAVCIAGAISLLTASGAAASSSERPFKATLTESLNQNGPVSGNGHANHMGNVSESGSTFFDFSNFPASAVAHVTAVLTAANGDQVSVSYVATLTDTASPPQGTNYHESGNYTITGGTGRFAGASGSGTIVGVCTSAFSNPVATCSDTWTGTIGY
jgi:hypothetical protein